MYNKKRKHIPIASGLYTKSVYPDIFEDKYESYCGEEPQSGCTTDVDYWFISWMSYYNKFFKEIFSINIPLNEDSITPLHIECSYCNEYMSENLVIDHNHLNGNFRDMPTVSVTSKLRTNLVPKYAFNSTNYDNHLLITELAKKIR